MDLLPQNHLPTGGLLRSPHRPTTVKTRVIAQNQHLLRADREETNNLVPEEEAALWELIQRAIEHTPPDLVLFQDYNKGVLTPTIIRQTLKLAEEKGIPTAVDPKKTNFWAYQGITLFKPNLKEVRDSLENTVDPTLNSLQAAAEEIRRRLNNQITLITLSEKGLFLDEAGSATIIGTRPRSIADVCGAGDTVISVAAAALAAGVPLPVMAELANLAGGQVCEKVGVVPVDRDALREEFQALHR
jgi:rfaE bifunctional protein kinase chain/domain